MSADLETERACCISSFIMVRFCLSFFSCHLSNFKNDEKNNVLELVLEDFIDMVIFET